MEMTNSSAQDSIDPPKGSQWEVKMKLYRVGKHSTN